jgi:hypothetical protein
MYAGRYAQKGSDIYKAPVDSVHEYDEYMCVKEQETSSTS